MKINEYKKFYGTDISATKNGITVHTIKWRNENMSSVITRIENLISFQKGLSDRRGGQYES